MLRPSLTLVLDLDERVATEDTALEIKRSYAHICTPVIRTHAASDDDARNTARALVKLGTQRYLDASVEGADACWNDIVEPWIANLLHKVGNNMKVFNDRQRHIDLPEVHFERFDIELEGGSLVLGLHPSPSGLLDPSLRELIGLARTLVNNGTLKDAQRINMPSDESYESQRSQAWESWIETHPETLEETAAHDGDEVECASINPEPEKSPEEKEREDIEAKSYENTAVAPTNSNALPRPKKEEEEEPEQFDFKPDYALWSIARKDGGLIAFDSRANTPIESPEA